MEGLKGVERGVTMTVSEEGDHERGDCERGGHERDDHERRMVIV